MAKKQIDPDATYPKFLVRTFIPGKESEYDQKRYVNLRRARILWDSGMVQVEIGDWVLEEDHTLRPITPEENAMIQEIADDHSESK